MISPEFINEYSDVLNSRKEFKAVSSYLLITENPKVEELDIYVAKTLDFPEFKLWELLKTYVGLDQENNKEKNLNGFFKYFGIQDMEEFSHNKVGKMLFKYLKINWGNIRLYWKDKDPNYFATVKFTVNDTRIYFYHQDGTYLRLELDHFWNRCTLLNIDLLNILSVEREIDNNWQTEIINLKDEFYFLEKFKL